MAAAVAAALGVEGRLSRLTGSGTSGCFLFEPARGVPLFLKSIPERRLAQMREVDALVEKLGEIALACRRQREVALGDHGLIVYPYVAGRRVRMGRVDLQALGGAIAELHAALRRHDDAATVRTNARAWFGHLEAAAEHAAAGTIAGYPKAAAKCLAARNRPLDYGLDAPQAQPLHGDLNFGNVIAHDNGIAIVDFENAVRSFGPPLLDLAFALERFCFSAKPDAATETALARALLDGYGTVAPAPTQSDIEDALMLHARRALAVLAAKTENAMAAEPSEIEKFLFLVADAARKAGVIAAAFARGRQ
jgi:Ser/Thr protein kinase RdoA (MazF antagonist)